MAACACRARASACAIRDRAALTSKLLLLACSIRPFNSGLPKPRYQSLPGQAAEEEGNACSNDAGIATAGSFVGCKEQPAPIPATRIRHLKALPEFMQPL